MYPGLIVMVEYFQSFKTNFNIPLYAEI